MPMTALVVGAGGISRQHLGCLTTLPEVSRIHVCDLSPVTARAMADRFGLASWSTDFEKALALERPDIVHVTTPPSSHSGLVMQALEAGAHVIVEKPATLASVDTLRLLDAAKDRGLMLVEDYNYVFDPGVQRALRSVGAGCFGDLVHVDVEIALDIYGPGSPFLDPATNASFRAMPGGPVADFLPHLASLAHAFIGAHHSVKTSWTRSASPAIAPFPDGMRALIEGERATATVAFSARARPDHFSIRVEGTRRRSRLNLFEGRTTTEQQLGVAAPLVPLLNGLREGWQVGYGSLAAMSRKISGGAGAYEGLWVLVREVYAAVESGGAPPVTGRQVREVTALVDALAGEVGAS